MKAENDSASTKPGEAVGAPQGNAAGPSTTAAASEEATANGSEAQPAGDGEPGSPSGIQQKQEDQVAATEPEEAERIHAQFMAMLLQAIEQSLDTSQFEDSCRALLGSICQIS